jgi:hypothetical protein
MRTHGCDNDEIPSSVGRENLTMDASTQRGTQWSPESLSGDEDDDSKANILLPKGAWTKCVSGSESDEEVRIPYVDELSTDGPVHKTPGFHRSLRACIRKLDQGEKELDEAIEEYQNTSWRTPSLSKEVP